MIVVDSREKKWEHIKTYFDRHNIPYTVRKLDVGDYMAGNGNVTIDRKQNLSELSRNLTNKADHARFMREVRRANEQGIRLIVLCEHGGRYKSLADIAEWTDKRTGVTGRRLQGVIHRLTVAYDVRFTFCCKKSTAKIILELLRNEHEIDDETEKED